MQKQKLLNTDKKEEVIEIICILYYKPSKVVA
jgi:hypothetical protein